MRTWIAWLAAALVLAGCSASTGGNGSGGKSTPAPDARTPSSTSASSSGSTSASSKPPSATPHRVAPKLTGFTVASLTWIGEDGWALGEANCLSGNGRCDAFEHTSDGGRSWASLPAPAGAQVLVPDSGGNTDPTACHEPCLTGARFASTMIGYAYGLKAFYTSGDGGLSWHEQPGGAVGVEAADGNVIRVTSSGGGCPGPCHVGIETAPVGGTSWTKRSLGLSSSAFVARADFVRTGARAYLLIEANPAGGGEFEKSTLFRSGDDGRTWTDRGEPCPQVDREDDSALPSSGPDGSFAALCRPRGSGGNAFVVISTNGAATLRAGAARLGGAFTGALAVASSTTVLVSSDDTYRSTDGGNHFTRLSANAGSSPGRLGWLGFSSTSVGHGISADGRSVWTTRDGGRSWTSYRFS